MAFQVIQREPDESLGDVFASGLRGVISGRDRKRKLESENLQNLLAQAKIAQILQKSESLNAPLQPGFVRLPGGKVIPDPHYLDPLEQQKLSDLQAKEQEALQIRKNKEEMLQSSAEDMLSTVGEVKKGLKYFGPMGNIPTIAAPSTIASLGEEYGPRRNWEVNVNKLLSGKIVDLMSQMKSASKTGATGFGALSQKELAVLQEASTALKRDISPDDAAKYLNEIERMQRKVLSGKQSAGLPSGNNRTSGIPKRQGGGSQVGQIITGPDGRQYRIIGGDPNDPDVEPV